MWRDTCTEAEEQLRVGELLRYIAEGQQTERRPEWRVTLDAIDRHVRELVGPLGLWRKFNEQLVGHCKALEDERERERERGCRRGRRDRGLVGMCPRWNSMPTARR